ncbi:MAG: recombination-associated protein RdgC [Desulfovibrio sp.]|nr:recombination-associated protein RdgC [Desulfovibrio sp.]
MPGFFSSTMAMSIFRIQGKAENLDQVLETAAFSAQPQNPGPDEKIVGFVGLGNALDTDFTFAPEQGQFLALSLRVDERKPSQATIKMRLAQALKQEEDSHAGKISRARKKELKEEITAQVKAQSEPVPTLADLVWDQKRGLLLIASTADPLVELACELLSRVFSVEITALPCCPALPKLFEAIYAGDQPMRLSLPEERRALLGSYDYLVTLTTPENAAEKATVTARGSQEPGLKALEEGLKIKRLGILAQLYEQTTRDEQEPDEECLFLLDDSLKVSQLKMPKLEDKRDHKDREDRFLINAEHAVAVAHVVLALASSEA